MIDDFVKLFRKLARFPDLRGATLSSIEKNVSDSGSNDIKIQTSWALRNLENNEKLTYEKNYFIQYGENKTVTPFPHTVQAKTLVLYSADSRTNEIATIFQDEESCFLTITYNDEQTATLNLKELELHEKVYNDPELASICWSPDSTKFAYVAEEKRPKASTYFTKTTPTDKPDEGRGQKFALFDDWGEQMTGQSHNSIIVIEAKSLKTKVLSIPKGYCGGQVVWSPDGSGLVGVAFETTPYRLGLIYCRNRKSVLFHLDLEGNFTILPIGDCHVQSPRFSPDGSKLVFLKSEIFGPHIRASQLCLLNWNDSDRSNVEVIIDIVEDDVPILDELSFPGIYGATILPIRCWTEDSKKIVFSSFEFYGNSSFIVDTVSNEIKRLPIEGNSVVQDLFQDYLLISRSSLTEPAKVMLTKLPEDMKKIVPDWTDISPSKTVDEIPVDWRDRFTFISKIAHPKSRCSDKPIPVLYFGPTKRQEGEPKRPLIVWCHGGPHSTYPDAYSLTTAFFVRLGYSIIFPNFRGSLGQGSRALESLPGHIGRADVEDCYQATLEALKRYDNVLNPSKVVLCGGSHGGFLVTHLSAKYPGFYKVVSTRNPAIDPATMSAVSDIPDWCFTEAGIEFNHSLPVVEPNVSKMSLTSALNKIDFVDAPTLILLGKNDRRVPMSQGLYYHKMLLARKIPTKVFVYDDCHPLSKVDVEADTAIQTALWYHQHLSTEGQS